MRTLAANQQDRGSQVIAEMDMAAFASRVEAQIAEVAREASVEALSPPKPEEPENPTRPFASSRALAVTWVLCIGLTAANLEIGLFRPKPELPEPFDLIVGLKTSAAMNALLIEDYLAEHGRLPSSLAAIGLSDDDPLLDYQRTSERDFRLAVRHDEFEGVFDSRLDAERRAALAAARAAEAQRLAAERDERIATAERQFADAQVRAEELRRRAQEEQRRENLR